MTRPLRSFVAIALLSAVAAANPVADDTTRPVAPGEHGFRPFWNNHARRFIYAPAFDLPEVTGAASYRFILRCADGRSRQFAAASPTVPLSPVWGDVPEGVTTLLVDGLDSSGKVIGSSGERTFYRSPGFDGHAGDPTRPYADAARDGLAALFRNPSVQHWLTHGTLDRNYRIYNYPNKVMGGVIRAMATYSQVAANERDREAALNIGRRVADYLLDRRLPADARYAHVPPTYSLDVANPYGVTKERVAKRWLFVLSATDAAFGFLDLHDATKDPKYLEAVKSIADTFVRTQESDGTWPLMIDWQTGEAVAPQRLIPTWVIFLFDRLERQYHLTGYRNARARAWEWIERNPLRTYQWDGQFEDVKLLEPYGNLAREQACDVAVLLMSEPGVSPERLAQAEDLLRFAEDQFVVWAPVKDPDGFGAVVKRTRESRVFITPCVLEQYNCYQPVARSSMVLINTYLKAYEVTGKDAYFAKARALTNGLLKGQAWAARAHNAGGEIPTWLMTDRYSNWLNNSFYAAEGVRTFGLAASAARPGAAR